MARSKKMELKTYLLDNIKELLINGGEPEKNEIWEELVIPYLCTRFSLQERTVRNVITNVISDTIYPYVGTLWEFVVVPEDIYIDARAQMFVDSLGIDDVAPWHRVIDTVNGFDYVQQYWGQFYLTDLDIPDYYDMETSNWVMDEVDRLLSDRGYWLESGEGSATDLYLCRYYDPSLFIESITLIDDDGTDIIEDNLMISQMCSE